MSKEVLPPKRFAISQSDEPVTYAWHYTIGCKKCGTDLRTLTTAYPCQEGEIPVYGYKAYCPKCELRRLCRKSEEIKVLNNGELND